MIKEPGKQRYTSNNTVAEIESMEDELCKRLRFKWQEHSGIGNEVWKTMKQ